MMKHKIAKIILIIVILLTIEKVEAAHYSVNYVSLGGGTTTSEKKDYTQTEVLYSGDKHTQYTYTCTYNYSIGYTDDIYINGYNMDDEEIMKHSINVSENDAIPAGTAIGLNMYEQRTVSWRVTKAEVTVQALKQKKRNRCIYRNTCQPQDIDDTAFGEVGCSRCSLWYSSIKRYYYYETSNQYCVKTNYYPSCEFSYREDWGYEKEYTIDVSDSVTIPEEKITQCENLAKTKAISAANNSVYASYEIKLPNSNDIDKVSDSIKITKSEAEANRKCYNSNNSINSKCKFEYSGNLPERDSLTIHFNYIKNNVCINAKNSKVEYRTGSCTKDEIQVPNKIIDGLEHWHYFVPLNATSNDIIEINMMPSGNRTLSAGQCNGVMQGYPVVLDKDGNIVEEKLNGTLGTMYTNLITPVNENTSFIGDYCKKDHSGNVTCTENESISKDYKEMKENGCKLTSKIQIPIKQKFYNEVKKASKITFDGFNFYYKPINVDGATKDNQRSIVFQNGLKTPSLWEDWYKAQTDRRATTEEKSPDLTQSFTKKPTYVASNIKASQIRTYNKQKENNYTSWEKMNIDGKSQFINTQGMIFRVEPGEIYKLGCGPANSDSNSPLYINGCGKS